MEDWLKCQISSLAKYRQKQKPNKKDCVLCFFLQIFTGDIPTVVNLPRCHVLSYLKKKKPSMVPDYLVNTFVDLLFKFSTERILIPFHHSNKLKSSQNNCHTRILKKTFKN